MTRPQETWLLLTLLLWIVIFPAGAEEIELGPTDDWFTVLNGSSLQPGDVVVLKEGTYTHPRKLTLGHRGTEQAPIVIRGKEGERVVFQRPDARQNTFNLEGAEYLTLRDFEITGGSSGIRISDPDQGKVRHITLRGLHIQHIGGVAVTCNHAGNTYERMHFHDNHIHHTGGHGEAFYLGANNDKAGKTMAVFRHSIVEKNYLHHLNGPNISQGDGIEVKDGSYGNTIRNNVIHDTKYPGITIYGTDGNEPNRIEGNVIWNTSDHGIQVASDAILRENIILDTGGDGIRSQNHQSARVGNLQILANTILKEKGIGVRIDMQADATGPVTIRNNTISAPTPYRVPDDGRIAIERNRENVEGDLDQREVIKKKALDRFSE